MLSIGDAAPDIPLPAAAGDDHPASLYAMLERGPVVVYFYPADFTPLCTKEACMFRDAHDDLMKLGVRVVGVSTQSEESHTKFRDRHGLPFALVADRDKAVVEAWGVRGPLGIGTRRATFLVGTDRQVEDRAVGDLGLGKHNAFLARLRERFGERAST
jgi:peroxiredoxin Q/BCP